MTTQLVNRILEASKDQLVNTLPGGKYQVHIDANIFYYNGHQVDISNSVIKEKMCEILIDDIIRLKSEWMEKTLDVLCECDFISSWKKNEP